MAIVISIDKLRHRGDSTDWPIVTASGYSTYGRIKVGEWLYYNASASFDLVLPNRSEPSLVVWLRKVTIPAFTLGSGVSQSTSTFTRTSGTGWVGAYYNTALSAVKCSIEGTTTDLDLISGISLQNGDVTPTNDFTNVAVAHSLTFGPPVENGVIGKGWLIIREAGGVIQNKNEAYYEVGDKGLIELDNGIVRYYLVKPGGTLILLRATRSKLTVAPKATVLVYDAGASLSGVVIFDGVGDETSETIETVGALENFQDWQNDFFRVDTGQPITMADGESQLTYPNSRRVVRNLTANLNMRTKAQRDAFLAFFQYHAQGKEFLFVDNAHKDEDNVATEFFARFTSPFGDKARGSCLSVHQAQITETMRKDVFAKVIRESLIEGPSHDVDGGDFS